MHSNHTLNISFFFFYAYMHKSFKNSCRIKILSLTNFYGLIHIKTLSFKVHYCVQKHMLMWINRLIYFIYMSHFSQRLREDYKTYNQQYNKNLCRIETKQQKRFRKFPDSNAHKHIKDSHYINFLLNSSILLILFKAHNCVSVCIRLCIRRRLTAQS